ncbi:GntR family transcriptional regulator [Bordetella sp. 2513F-2]
MATTFGLRPGERVNELELARQLGVSRTPVREALSRIAAEGFLVPTPNRGYTVRPLDARQILQLYEYRATVELGVVRLACERASDDALRELAEFADQTRDEPESDAQAIRLLWRDEAFHERLAALAGNEEFLRSVKSINERIRFARWLDLKTRRSLTRNDHPEIMRALLARDLDGAQALMRKHIEHHLDHLVALTRAGYAEIYMGNALADYAESRLLETETTN